MGILFSSPPLTEDEVNRKCSELSRMITQERLQEFEEKLSSIPKVSRLSVLSKQDGAGWNIAHKIASKALVKHMLCIGSYLSATQFYQLLSTESREKVTPAHKAVAKGSTDLVELMISHLWASDFLRLLEMQNSHGNTMLHLAALKGQTDSLSSIVNKVSPSALYNLLEIHNNDGMTVFHVLAEKNPAAAATFDLCCNKVRRNRFFQLVMLEDNQKNTVLMKATLSGLIDVVEVLVESVPESERYSLLAAMDKSQNTAVHQAICKGHVDIVQLFMKSLHPDSLHKILIRKNKKGENAMHLLVRHGNCGLLSSVMSMLEPLQCLVILDIKTDETGELMKDIAKKAKYNDMINYMQDFQQEVKLSTTRAAGRVRGQEETSFTRQDTGANHILRNVELENKIGKGGECTVYKATWSMSNVAVKVFQNITEGEDDCCFQELINIRTLAHPNIVAFYGITTLDIGIGLVIELCDMDLLAYSKKLTTSKAELLKVIKDAVQGLVYLHDLKLIHLDIKPKNILVKSGEGKLADFGLAGNAANFSDMTETRHPWSGTPLYRAPELYHRAAPTKAADMWSMGLTVLQVFTRSAPYAASKVPTGQASDELPESLLVMNQKKSAIYRHVLTLDPRYRLSACNWLQHLNQWKP